MSETPIEQRISHRVLVYAAKRAPSTMNQFAVEDIVKEEIAELRERAERAERQCAEIRKKLPQIALHAIRDPGYYTPRGNNCYEFLGDWQLRAMQIAITEMDESIAGRGWLSPETARRLVEALEKYRGQVANDGQSGYAEAALDAARRELL